MFNDQLPRLNGLLALSGTTGLDIHPTLLRVITDMFVNTRHHTEADIKRFTELATHLIDQVDEPTRLIIAEKLGPCPATPRIIVNKLIASEPEAADRIISISPLLTSEDLWALASDGGPMTAAALAKRPDLDSELVRFLARKEQVLVAEALAANPAAPLDRGAIAHLSASVDDRFALGKILASRADIPPPWLAPLFLDLGLENRIRVIDAVVSEASTTRLSPREAQIIVPSLALDALEQSALSRNLDELSTSLASMLGCAPNIAERIVCDPHGDALAIALIAVGMPADQAGRVLMFSCPQAATSVSAMRHLTLCLEAMPRMAATRLIRAMSDAPTASRAARHEPVYVENPPVRGGGQNGYRLPAVQQAPSPKNIGAIRG